MGIYLNQGNMLFKECLNAEIYVDKTRLIHFTNKIMNTENKLVCVSRPRRFGKSMALKMLAAYYSKGCDSKELFEPLKVCQFETPHNGREEELFRKQAERYRKNLNSHDVLWIDMQGVIGTVMEEAQLKQEYADFSQKCSGMKSTDIKIMRHPLLVAVQRELIRGIRKNKEYAAYIPEGSESLGNALVAVHEHTGNQFVILIDEWDCIFRNYKEDRLLQDKYIDWLRDMFKNTGRLAVYSLVYMTGILPVKRYNTQSALNNFKEYTMLEMSPLEEFAGFTQDEAFALYEQYGMDKEKAREWYDGYQLDNFGHIYNPNSVIESVTRGKFKSFWTATGTYESIKTPISMNFDGLREKIITMLGNGRCRINVRSFKNDMVTFNNTDDVLTLLIHLGYLGYDSEKSEVYIPNKEMRQFLLKTTASCWN